MVLICTATSTLCHVHQHGCCSKHITDFPTITFKWMNFTLRLKINIPTSTLKQKLMLNLQIFQFGASTELDQTQALKVSFLFLIQTRCRNVVDAHLGIDSLFIDVKLMLLPGLQYLPITRSTHADLLVFSLAISAVKPTTE